MCWAWNVTRPNIIRTKISEAVSYFIDFQRKCNSIQFRFFFFPFFRWFVREKFRFAFNKWQWDALQISYRRYHLYNWRSSIATINDVSSWNNNRIASAIVGNIIRNAKWVNFNWRLRQNFISLWTFLKHIEVRLSTNQLATIIELESFNGSNNNKNEMSNSSKAFEIDKCQNAF